MPRRKRLIDQPTTTRLDVSDAMIHELRASVQLRELELMKAEKYLVEKGLATLEIQEYLEVIRGSGPTRPGLKSMLGFTSEADPDQTDIAGSLGPEADE